MPVTAPPPPTRTLFTRHAAPIGAIICLAALLLLPVILGPVRTNDSHWINITWSAQFSALMRDGVVWPRWLPWSHDGLGAPVFYFYGPVAFWAAGLFAAAGLATWPALVATALAASILSGFAMRAYLAGSTRRPLAGALFFMAAPYHVLDFQMRGALAEYCAFAVVPLVALGIRRAANGSLALLSLAYAALVLTHLPSALIASVFLIPPLVFVEARRDRAALLRCAIAIALGLALAAPYLLPALALRGTVALSTMSGTASLRAASWTPFAADPALRTGLAMLGIIGGTSAFVGMIGAWRGDRWGWAVLAGAAIALGLTPWLWRLPLLADVQFPWRTLLLVEFGAAVIVARSSLAPERLALAVAPAAIMTALLLAQPAPRNGPTLGPRHPDVIEYLPRGVGEQSGIRSTWALRLAAHTPRVRARQGETIVHRFAFPIWQVRCADRAVASDAEPGTGLIRYHGSGCRIVRRTLPSERIGFGLTIAAALGLLFPALRRRAGSPLARASRIPHALPT